MVRIGRISTLGLACAAGVLGLGGASAPAFAAGSIKAAYVAPLVFNPNQNNITCVAAEVTTLLHGGSVEIDVNGVVN